MMNISASPTASWGSSWLQMLQPTKATFSPPTLPEPQLIHTGQKNTIGFRDLNSVLDLGSQSTWNGTGTTGNDAAWWMGSHNQIQYNSMAGNDFSYIGGGQNQFHLSGGDGLYDILVFNGKRNDYRFSREDDGSTRFRNVLNGNEGTFSAYELVRFTSQSNLYGVTNGVINRQPVTVGSLTSAMRHPTATQTQVPNRPTHLWV